MTEPCPCGYKDECAIWCADGHGTGECPGHPTPPYDSAGDTLKHALRVGELMGQPITELVERSVQHDHSKTEDPEKETFDRVTPQLKTLTYGSDEYKAALADMGPALAHHYSANRHHPEHFTDGVTGMTLVDLVEMLADWKAATERHADGDLAKSLEIQRERFGISDQLLRILANTAAFYGWLGLPRPGVPLCGVAGKAPDGTVFSCNRPARSHREHSDGNFDGGQLWWTDGNVAGLDGGEWALVARIEEDPDPLKE